MIPLLSAEEAKKRARDAGVSEDFARLNVFRMLLQNPTVARAAASLLGTLMNQNSIEARIRELVILRTARRTGSEYEFCRHLLRSRALAMSEQEILGVRDPANCAAYSEVDRAVITMADELSDRAQVSRATMTMLERAFTSAQIIELVIAAGNWRMFAALFNTAELPLDDDIASGWPEAKHPPH